MARGEVAKHLQQNVRQVIDEWVARVREQVDAASCQTTLALRDSMPGYLEQLADIVDAVHAEPRRLSDFARRKEHAMPRLHGKQRATLHSYSLAQVVHEYRLLRESLFAFLGEADYLNPAVAEAITVSIMSSIADAASAYAEAMNTAQERFGARLAHDMRSPLTAAKICAERIAMRPQDEQAVARLASRICKSSERIDDMVQELLDASRARSAERAPLGFVRTNLNAICIHVVDELDDIYQVPVTYAPAQDDVGDWCEDAVRRILENLVSNAAKYGEEAAPISVALRRDRMSVELSVSNRGPAIPPEAKALLFEQYRRADTAGNKPGWGVGLAVVSSLVEAHHGTIRVDSEPGGPTRFVVRLPVDCGVQAANSDQ